MQIVIDIPDEVKEVFDIANIADVDCYVDDYALLLGKAIKNCIPLPEGDAISRQYLLDNCVMDKVTMPYVPINKIQDAPTIIEADKNRK